MYICIYIYIYIYHTNTHIRDRDPPGNVCPPTPLAHTFPPPTHIPGRVTI